MYLLSEILLHILGWEGSANDQRVLQDAMDRGGFEVPYSKYFLADAGYVNKGTTFPEFFRQMDIAFLDTSLRDKALSKLNPLRQHNRSFSELVSEFDRILTVKDPVGRRITPNRSGKSTTD
jgi:hypothetical protein